MTKSAGGKRTGFSGRILYERCLSGDRGGLDDDARITINGTETVSWNRSGDIGAITITLLETAEYGST